MSNKLRELVMFLLGETPLDGVWFGDSDTESPRPRYWWRDILRAALSDKPVQGVEGWKPSEQELLAYAGQEALFLFAGEEDYLAIANGVLELVQIKLNKSAQTPPEHTKGEGVAERYEQYLMNKVDPDIALEQTSLPEVEAVAWRWQPSYKLQFFVVTDDREKVESAVSFGRSVQPLFTFSPSAQAAALWMQRKAAEICFTRPERDRPSQEAGGQDNSDGYVTGYSEGCGDCHYEIKDLLPPSDLVVMTRDELMEFGMKVAEDRNSDFSVSNLRAIVSQHMPKGEGE